MGARNWVVVATTILLVGVGVACDATQPATEGNVTTDQETGYGPTRAKARSKT